jgi:hypothetical protein
VTVVARFAMGLLIAVAATGLAVARRSPECSAREPSPAFASSTTHHARFAQHSAATDDWLEHADEDDVTDLYGNGVTDAVAKYRLDSDGSLYELHSPQTELPRLHPPRS